MFKKRFVEIVQGMFANGMVGPGDVGERNGRFRRCLGKG